VLSLSVVIPAWNEEANIAMVVTQVSRELQSLDWDHEIILVNDGSRDGTSEIAMSLVGHIPHLKVVEHWPRRGYGGALKAGFAHSTKSLVAIFPGDNQFDFREVRHLAEKINGVSIVAGYRAKRRDPLMRSVNALGWKLLIRLLFGYLARDVDCGFKIFRRELLNVLTLVSDGAMIDAELLAGAKSRGFKIAEVPVTHLPRVRGRATGANVRVILRAFGDCLTFRVRLSRELRAEKARFSSEARSHR
jgi:glycosyltransferase involved in cell wall biosynthesis